MLQPLKILDHSRSLELYNILTHLGSTDETSEESVWSVEQADQCRTAVQIGQAVVVVVVNIRWTADLQPQFDLQRRYMQDTYSITSGRSTKCKFINSLIDWLQNCFMFKLRCFVSLLLTKMTMKSQNAPTRGICSLLNRRRFCHLTKLMGFQRHFCLLKYVIDTLGYCKSNKHTLSVHWDDW